MSRVIARGSIRVDARRAVAGLREHLLVDLHQYLLELCRAAVAGGAAWIDVRHDADDLAVTFDGAAIPRSALARLLDHVLEEAPTPEARRIRLFALGVNAALGLGPASVDVLCRDEEACVRVRWTPALLSADPAAPMKLPEPERVSAPEGMPPGSTRVAVRRRLGWDVLKKAITGGAPRELDLLADAAFGLPAKLSLAGQPFPRSPRPEAIVRVPFDLPDTRSAALEIVPARSADPIVELLEHGVCLIRAKLDFTPAFPSLPFEDIDLPARVVVFADALPTNASRGRIREDAPLGRLILDRALGAFHDALLALAAVVAGEGEVPPGVEILPSADPTALEDALGAVLCVVAGAMRTGAALPDGVRALLELPILRSAHGDPIAIASLRGTADRPVGLWKRADPIPADLRPWTGETVWIRGRIAERALAGMHTGDAEARIKPARASADRRRRLLAGPPSDPVLPEIDRALVRAVIDDRAGPWAGVRGEVAILAEDPGARRIHVFIEDRRIETLEVDAALIPLPVEIAIAWDGRLRPRFDYDGVEQDEALRLAVYRAIEIAASEAVSSLLAEGLALHPVIRAAIGAVFLAPAQLGIARIPDDPQRSSLLARLRTARVWPTTEPDRMECLETLAAFAARSRGICVADPGTSGRAADGRPVVAVTAREASWLGMAVSAPLVPYTDALIGGASPEARAERSDRVLRAAMGDLRAPSLLVQRPGVRARIAIAPMRRVTLCHAGRILMTTQAYVPIGDVAVAVDDDSIVPTASWSGVLSIWSPSALEPIERAFRERIVAAIEGDPRAQAELGLTMAGPFAQISPDVADYLFDRLAKTADASAADAKLAARIRLLPLFTALDERGIAQPTSLTEIALTHPAPAPIPVLGEPPGFPTLRWRPVIAATPKTLDWLNRWAIGRAVRAEAEIPARRAAAQAEEERRAFLSGPEHDPTALGDLADPTAPSVFLDRTGAESVSVAVGLPKASLLEGAPSVGAAVIDVLFQGRALCRRPLPAVQIQLVATVGVHEDAHIVGLRDLSRTGLDRVADRVEAGARSLACNIVNRASGPGMGAMLFRDLRVLRLVRALLGPRDRAISVAAQLSLEELGRMLVDKALLWPTVQGEDHPFEALATGDDDQILFGVEEIVPWHPAGSARKAELDRPVLLCRSGPEGEVIRDIVSSLQRDLRDVTEALRRLQARRARAGVEEVPTLPGAPIHPALRVRIDALKIDGAEGEIEIIAGPTSDVRLLDDLTPVPQVVSASLPFPLRILARVPRIDLSHEGTPGILRDIASAVGKHLVSLVPILGELPPFVRDHLRVAVCKAASKQRKIGKAVAAAKLFPDTTGAVHSYADLTQCADLAATTMGPPYPKRVYQTPILCLSDHELSQIKGPLRLRDVGALLRRDLDAERRETGPEVAAIAIAPEVRARCAVARAFADGPVTGEIGLLDPAHEGSRGIAVHKKRRRVCMIDDGPGWPVVAVVNDDDVVVNRFFDDISEETAARLRTWVRAAALDLLKALLAPPADALAVRWLDGSEIAGAGLSVAGAIYLPAEWPRDPRVEVRLPGAAQAAVPRSLVASEAPPHVFGDVPVAGRILASADGPWHAASTVALRLAAEMVADLAKAGSASPAIPHYQWDLALLGHTEVDPPPAPTGDGGARTASEVIAELASHGSLWVSDGRGELDGPFPAAGAALPSFVLRAGSPLVEVLRRRAVPGVLCDLTPAPSAGAVDLGTPEARRLALPPPDIQAFSDDAAHKPEGTADDAAKKPWAGEIWSAVRALFGRDDPEPVETPLTAALEAAIAEIDLPTRPVHAVVEARSGPPVRFEEARGRLVVNPRHRALAWLGPDRAQDPRAMIFLLTAALSEINRALLGVTDEEERRALGGLLEREGKRVEAAEGRGERRRA